ncbi:MAG: peptidylprolyl isomerase [Alphaproteobacteria bacterium]|jgi:peptidyl-prolyl cis-trans isomerase C|nr:peptidylprolyl isomerase [Alphaproteobacteria bacterium]MBL6851644.1 peptidylprolyl isomerase [Alphaproteobacteria bacterium]
MSSFKTFFLVAKIILVLSIKSVSAKEPSSIVAAKINNHVISAQDVLNAINTLPQNVKKRPLPEIYPRIVNELINQYLITKRAYEEKIDLDTNVINLIQKSKDQILAKYWLNNFVRNETREEKINQFYDNYLKSFSGFKEANASHILVKTREEAISIIEKLNKQSNFSELARIHSTGPSGKNGGELGWFAPGQMVKGFENATFALKKGETTQEPVETKFGFHIIKLNDIRDAKPKKLDEIRENIIDQITKNSLANLEKKIRKNHEITIVDFDDIVKEVNN